MERLGRGHVTDDAGLADGRGEALLVPVDVLAERRVAGDAQRHVSRGARVHDGAGSAVADDHVGLATAAG